MYKITATVIKSGGSPVNWMRLSQQKMTATQCEKMLFKPKEVGKSFGDHLHIENFRCEKVA